MVSKNQIKLITSLYQKKYRNLSGLFIAEGIKVINELIENGMELEKLYTTNASFFNVEKSKCVAVSDLELKKISLLKSPNTALAIFKMSQPRPIHNHGLIIALDNINDPGNLGTIMRLCDWYGITDLVCSKNTVDCYNPKVVQATMGSLARVNTSYTDLNDYIRSAKSKVFIADMDGENVYKASLPENGILVMGNEANGISDQIKSIADSILSIPRFGKLQLTESLNVATATAILLSEFKRKM